MFCVLSKAIIMISPKKKGLGISNAPYDEYSNNYDLARKKENNKNNKKETKTKQKIKQKQKQMVSYFQCTV